MKSSLLKSLASLSFLLLINLAYASEYENASSPVNADSPGERLISVSELKTLCGPTSLYTVYRMISRENSLTFEDLLSMCDYRNGGMTFSDLVDVAEDLGLVPHALWVDVDYLYSMETAAILMVHPSAKDQSSVDHYVTLLGTKDKNALYLIDSNSSGFLSKKKFKAVLCQHGVDIGNLPIIQFESKEFRKNERKETANLTAIPETINLVSCDSGNLAYQRTEFTVTIKNSGQRNVILSKLVSTCKCLDVKLSSTALSPGQKATITGRIDVYPGMKNSQRVLVYQADGTNNPLIISINVNIPAPIEWSENTVFLGELGQNGKATETISFLIPTKSKLQACRVQPSDNPYRGIVLETFLGDVCEVMKDETTFSRYAVACQLALTECPARYYGLSFNVTLKDAHDFERAYSLPVEFYVLESN